MNNGDQSNVMQQQPRAREPQGGRSARPVVLSTANLRKTYRMGKVDVAVLKGVDLSVRAGEWVAVLGASGCGKSTLLHLLGDLDRPDTDSGGVKFDGRQLQEMTLHGRNLYRNQTVGFVFQFYHLLPELNVLENTMLHALVKPSLRRARFWAVVSAIGAILGMALGVMAWRTWEPMPLDALWKRVALSAVAAVLGAIIALPVVTEFLSFRLRLSPSRRRIADHATEVLNSFGLGHRLRHRPRELSGGERQRVAIARALMNKPQVLLADEPTGNLDEKTGQEILDLIAEQHRQGLTIVMVTHDPAIAQRADRVVHLHDGRVVEG